jgi:hypothetical protein
MHKHKLKDELRREMLKKGHTIMSAANNSDIGYETFKKIYSGETLIPTIQNLKKLSQYGVDLNSLANY